MSGPVGGDTITVWVTTTGTTPNKLGVKPTTSTPVDQSGCSVERLSEEETETNVDRTITRRTVYAPPTALMQAVKTQDRVGYMGKDYNVDGDIDIETDLDGRIDHVRFVIRRAAG
ncbi:hypothetical protein [Gordonia sp. N1V]|uniref:hypothetical protein n=1 Tax=Gordonia sp. N1V TaxID=3034163 RepID=UPI0023E198E2|nr:hypothetical protein [Gordonia sp. N1V]MDF3280920.1 hypothetical protein [Gordonia sp. N1V]